MAITEVESTSDEAATLLRSAAAGLPERGLGPAGGLRVRGPDGLVLRGGGGEVARGAGILGSRLHRLIGQTLQGSFSAVSKPIFRSSQFLQVDITSLGPRSRRVRIFQTFRFLLLFNFFSFRDVFSIDKKSG